MAVKVYQRILQLLEAEGINTLFGIPDPNFVHMFLEAEQRGWTVVAPHHEAAAGFMAEAADRPAASTIPSWRSSRPSSAPSSMASVVSAS